MHSYFSRRAQLQGHRGAVYALQARGDLLYSAGGDGWIARWDLRMPQDGTLLAQVKGQLFSLCLPAQGPFQCIAGDMHGGMHWLDLEQPANNRHWTAHSKGIYDLLPCGPDLISLGGDGRLCWWDPHTARSAESIILDSKALRKAACSPDGQYLAIGSSSGQIHILDPRQKRLIQSIRDAHLPAVFALAFSADGRYLFSGGRDAHLRIWDLEAHFTCVSDLAAHWFTINDLLLLPGSGLLISASRDKTLRIWNAEDGTLLQSLDRSSGGHINSVNRLCAIPGERGFISAGDDRTMILWAGAQL